MNAVLVVDKAAAGIGAIRASGLRVEAGLAYRIGADVAAVAAAARLQTVPLPPHEGPRAAATRQSDLLPVLVQPARLQEATRQGGVTAVREVTAAPAVLMERRPRGPPAHATTAGCRQTRTGPGVASVGAVLPPVRAYRPPRESTALPAGRALSAAAVDASPGP